MTLFGERQGACFALTLQCRCPLAGNARFAPALVDPPQPLRNAAEIRHAKAIPACKANTFVVFAERAARLTG
jgi:hypothetical protein